MAQPPHDIRYVCLSDLHLGEEDSLLTCLKASAYAIDPAHSSPVLEQLVACLRHLIDQNRGSTQPTLILNGDILDLAFGTFSHALMTFERFLELILAPGRELFGEILYLPGNHDHHIWEIARETQYVHTILNEHHPGGLPTPKHATPLFPDQAVPSYLLNQIVRHVQHPLADEHNGVRPQAAQQINVAYPNLLLRTASTDRHVVLHHGHYVEALYHFMSKTLRWLFPDRAMPTTVDQLEAENFAWIDFVWSLLGRSGAAGDDVEALFKMLPYPERLGAFIDDLARRIAEAKDLPFIPGDWLEQKALKQVFALVGRKMAGERCAYGEACSHGIAEGLRSYLFGPTCQQLRDELGHLPDDLAFVFGHTHKPFAMDLQETADRPWIQVYNTGGWTLDVAEPRPANGASVLLADADLRLVSVHLYTETDDKHPVRLQQTIHATEADRAFRDAIARRLRGTRGEPNAPVWQELSARIGSALARRQQHQRETYLA
ncbi:MAG: metallophosphoesterase [Rhodothermales bacterium]